MRFGYPCEEKRRVEDMKNLIDYLLRNVPGDLWRQAKIAAAERGVSLRDLLLAGLKAEIEKK